MVLDAKKPGKCFRDKRLLEDLKAGSLCGLKILRNQSDLNPSRPRIFSNLTPDM